MKILGIHDGHNASAALLEDGAIIAALSEERVSRVKNDPGYPRQAIDALLAMTGTKPGDIERVALATQFLHPREFYLNWDWYRKGMEDQKQDTGIDKEKKRYFDERLKERNAAATNHLGIPAEHIDVVEHHLGHAATAYFGSPWAGGKEPVLVLTLDGSGDGLCSTVSIGRQGELTRIATTDRNASLGKIYARITYLLGMKPWEHEYKLMGLAPYADQAGVAKSLAVLRELIDLDPSDGLTFTAKSGLSANYSYPYLKEKLENHRFDWIAGAMQKLTEELVVQWVKNAIKKTGIYKVACAGGVFMNVKANMLILNLKEVKELFVFPSCGDESLCMGVAYQVYVDRMRKKGEPALVTPLESLYLGHAFSLSDIERALEKTGAKKNFRVTKENDITKRAAELLAKGNIVARFAGRMEWGARSLGNRSILMDPRKQDGVRELNAAIKQRDFWMPFAPSVLKRRQSDYLINKKNVRSPYMILSFATTPEGARDLAAAIHPYDLTARPQIVEPNMNPEYHALIEAFEALTGVGALLNTSFNLHGEPIVCSPEDALSTFARSGLQFLILNDYLVAKKA